MKKLIFIMLLFILGCETTPEDRLKYQIDFWKDKVPKGATNIEPKGNSWVVFTLEKKRFLMSYVNGVPTVTNME